MIVEPQQNQGSLTSLADVTVTATAAQLGSLNAGANGIMFTAHPNNGAVIIRISGSDVSATKGQPLAAGASVVLNTGNANLHYVITETGSGTLCVTAV